MGTERDTSSEAVISVRFVVTPVTGWFVEQNFLVHKVFNSAILFKIISCISRKLESEMSCRLFAQYNHVCTGCRSQCLWSFVPIIRCAFDAHLDVGLAQQRSPCRFVGTLHFPFPDVGEGGRFWLNAIAAFRAGRTIDIGYACNVETATQRDFFEF